MAFVTVATLEQLRGGTVMQSPVAGQEMLIYRRGVAISAVCVRCTHLGMSLPAFQKTVS